MCLIQFARGRRSLGRPRTRLVVVSRVVVPAQTILFEAATPDAEERPNAQFKTVRVSTDRPFFLQRPGVVPKSIVLLLISPTPSTSYANSSLLSDTAMTATNSPPSRRCCSTGPRSPAFPPSRLRPLSLRMVV